ncbi:MAG: hypothetical protein EOP51_02255 [Sphingobacteriales bacterium]|nr:MAG: hypothetical protein EOP51_02255 [Sphingobacteriales bacterium]
MGYFLEAFICHQDDAQVFSKYYRSAKLVDLKQGLVLVPLGEELLNEITTVSSDSNIEGFELLTTDIERQVLNVIDDRPIAYIEAAYHGGDGGQLGLIWAESRRVKLLSFGQGRINDVLKYFGVTAGIGLDEFSTLALGKFRSTKEWVNN